MYTYFNTVEDAVNYYSHNPGEYVYFEHCECETWYTGEQYCDCHAMVVEPMVAVDDTHGFYVYPALPY
jgi:hypothetical protein